MLTRDRFEDDEAYELYIYIIKQYKNIHINISQDKILTFDQVELIAKDLDEL